MRHWGFGVSGSGSGGVIVGQWGFGVTVWSHMGLGKSNVGPRKVLEGFGILEFSRVVD